MAAVEAAHARTGTRFTLLAVAAVALLPLATGAPSASWLQDGYDPGQTGAIPFEGPATNDTAFQVHLPGTPEANTAIVDDTVYLATDHRQGWDGDTSHLDTAAVWRIELASATVEKLFEFPDGRDVGDPDPLLVRPDLVLFEQSPDLVALDMPSGEENWRYTVMPDHPLVVARDYGGSPVLHDGRVYVRYVVVMQAEAAAQGAVPTGTSGWNEVVGGVAALDPATGEELWRWERPRDKHPFDAGSGTPNGPDQLAIAGSSLAVDDERVYFYARTELGVRSGPSGELTSRDERRQYELWALDADDGRALWDKNDTEQRETGVVTPVGTVRLVNDDGSFCCARPVVTESRVHVRLDAFDAFNKATGEPVWPTPSPAGRTDQLRTQGMKSMGARGDVFLATSDQTLYRLNAATGDLDWLKNDPDQAKNYGLYPIVTDADTAYVPTMHGLCDFAGPGLEARELATGDLLWSWHYLPSVGIEGCSESIPHLPGFAPGVFVKGHKDGTVNVVGRTAASLGQPVVERDHYPGVGEAFELDLSDTGPGAFGPATRFRVFWGDGTTSPWQASPRFTHAFNASGDVVARLQVGNEANQTASSFVTFHVGEQAPNLLSTAFAQENQELTFGVLGIAVAVAGGAIGVARRHRSRTRLQDELEAIELAYEETHDRPAECEAQLTERKTHARGLLLDGQLNEEQFQVVRARIEELHRTLRLDALEAEFAFLPHALVVKAREMLEDGRVTALEADGFLAALDEVDGLGDEHRAAVRQRILAWRARDTSA